MRRAVGRRRPSVPRRSCYGEQLLPGADHRRALAEALEQARARARAGLERVDAPRCAEVGEGDPCELQGCVGEDDDPRASGLQPPECTTDVGIAPEVDRRAFFGETFEEPT